LKIEVFFLCIISLIFCFYSYPIGKFLSVIDIPDGKRKLHHTPVPQIGGIAIMIPVVLIAFYLSVFTELTKLYLVLALVSGLITILGFFDDRKNLPAVLRLFISIVLSFLALKYVSGLGVIFLFFSSEIQSLIGGPYFFGGINGYIFTIVCLVGLQNAVNMADGHNGIVTGMCLVWSLLLISYSPEHMLPLLLAFSLCLGIVMVFNLSGKIFLGDAGTYGISMIVGLMTIYIYNVNFNNLTADKIILMFIIPIIDTIRLMVQRVFSGRSPLSSDRNHFHHILSNVLKNHHSIVVYISIVAIPSILSIFWPNLTFVWLILVVLVYFSILIIYYFFRNWLQRQVL
tara:strand:+ start:279 stop:1307 length:1029 start_codon:yes stop_codon:yes gene_type:complete